MTALLKLGLAPSVVALPTTTQAPINARPPVQPVLTSPPPAPPSGGIVFTPPNTSDGGLLALQTQD